LTEQPQAIIREIHASAQLTMITQNLQSFTIILEIKYITFYHKERKVEVLQIA